jgi:signal transduction histidine kinase
MSDGGEEGPGMMRRAAVWFWRASGPRLRPGRRAVLVDVLIAVAFAACELYYAINYHAVAVHVLRVVPVYGGFEFKPMLASPHRSVTASCISALVIALPLVIRRRFPLAVFWLVILATLAMREYDTSVTMFAAYALVAYTAAAYSPYRGLALTSVLAGSIVMADVYQGAITNLPKSTAAFIVLFPLAVAGCLLRGLRERIAASHERERALEREKTLATRRAVEEERARIARELHDVITHNVSVMLVQAGAARKVLRRAPDDATSALLSVESAGRAAMAELRQAMGLLAPNGEAQLAPQPGLGELERLVALMQETGMRVSVSTTGEPQDLPPGKDLAAYRVVQESLTNAAKHAAGSVTRVRLDYQPHELVVEVANNAGRATPAATEGNGRGLIGLRERLAACGGEIQTGLRLDGGFRVRATIPLRDRGHDGADPLAMPGKSGTAGAADMVGAGT